jgi:hypothetical protein
LTVKFELGAITKQRFEPRERRDDFLNHPIRKVLLLGITGNALERQDRETSAWLDALDTADAGDCLMMLTTVVERKFDAHQCADRIFELAVSKHLRNSNHRRFKWS